MDVEDAGQSSSSSSEASFGFVNSEETSAAGEQTQIGVPSATEENQTTTVPIVSPTESLPEVVLNPEEWHQTFSNVSI